MMKRHRISVPLIAALAIAGTAMGGPAVADEAPLQCEVELSIEFEGDASGPYGNFTATDLVYKVRGEAFATCDLSPLTNATVEFTRAGAAYSTQPGPYAVAVAAFPPDVPVVFGDVCASKIAGTGAGADGTRKVWAPAAGASTGFQLIEDCKDLLPTVFDLGLLGGGVL